MISPKEKNDGTPAEGIGGGGMGHDVYHPERCNNITYPLDSRILRALNTARPLLESLEVHVAATFEPRAVLITCSSARINILPCVCVCRYEKSRQFFLGFPPP